VIDLRSVKLKIFGEAEGAYPDECCGALFGRITGEVKIISEIFPLANAREPDARGRRFAIEADEVMKAERAAAKKGLAVLGFYHSQRDWRCWGSTIPPRTTRRSRRITTANTPCPFGVTRLCRWSRAGPRK